MPHIKHSDTPAGGVRHPAGRVAIGLAALLGVLACTPTWNWRSVPLPGTQLVTELPCRPSRFQREVTVAGVPLQLFMLSCESGGVTYGVATADVVDPARVEGVLLGLRDSAAAARASGVPETRERSAKLGGGGKARRDGAPNTATTTATPRRGSSSASDSATSGVADGR